MRGAERREAHLGILRTLRRGAPLAKGARLSALHRGFFGLRGALLVSPYHLSVSERVAPGHNAEGPVRSPRARGYEPRPQGRPLLRLANVSGRRPSMSKVRAGYAYVPSASRI